MFHDERRQQNLWLCRSVGVFGPYSVAKGTRRNSEEEQKVLWRFCDFIHCASVKGCFKILCVNVKLCSVFVVHVFLIFVKLVR